MVKLFKEKQNKTKEENLIYTRIPVNVKGNGDGGGHEAAGMVVLAAAAMFISFVIYLPSLISFCLHLLFSTANFSTELVSTHV